MKNVFSSKSGSLLFLLCTISLFVGLYFNEDAGGGGTRADFINTWGYVQALKQNIFIDSSKWTRLLPLHYLFISFLGSIIKNEFLLRGTYCLISLLVPYLFYLNLKLKYPKINKNILLSLASIVLILPYYRSSSIWPNPHVTALIFFLLSTYFFIKWEAKKNFKIDFHLILHIIVLAIAVYTRRYYVIFFLYFIVCFFKNLKFSDFTVICLLILLLSLPGFWIIYQYPYYLTNSGFSLKFYNSILINSSIMSFYLIPLLLPALLGNFKIEFKNKKFYIISFVIIAAVVFFMSLFFSYNPRLGGGYILKLSNLLIDGNILFYLSSVIGFFIMFYISKENLLNLFMIFLIFLIFSNQMILQKYFEPMLIFIFFLIFHSKIPEKFLRNSKNIIFLYSYISIFLITAIINDVFKISINYFW